MPSLVLASGSPRRSELLHSLGVEFTIRPVDLDESRLDAETPYDYVTRLARAKAGALSGPDELLLAADTTVVCDQEVLGKPRSRQDAHSMLRMLAGRRHEVLTGVALHDHDTGRTEHRTEQTSVWIGALTDAEIEWYVSTGEPMDKAGSYAIQGLGALMVERIEGNYTNVIGLPLPAVLDLFGRFGLRLSDFFAAR